MAVLIPRGLHKLNPQLEPAFKSIADEFASLSKRTATSSRSSSARSSDLTNIQQQITAIEQILDLFVLPHPYKSAEPLPAFTVVAECFPGTLCIADSATTVGPVVGITMSSVNTGQNVALAGNFENIQNSAWSWTPGLPVYLSTAGSMSQSPSGSAPVMIGYAVSPTYVLVVISTVQMPEPSVPASLYEVVGTVTIPVNYNLLIAGNMHVSGDLVLHGDAVGV